MKINNIILAALYSACALSFAQENNATQQTTDVSLFWRKDSVQVEEIISDEPYLYKLVGHHGPAIENTHMILRLYYRDGGAIDVYSKGSKQLELAKYKWYPTPQQQAEGAGCDEYFVGNTVGIGGIALWDGEQEVKLIATKGRDARVKRTKKGAQIEMLHRGVIYMGDTVDIKVTIKTHNEHRKATVSAECTTGQTVRFFTGINYHPGQTTEYGDGYIAVWGSHPADVSKDPLPIGAGMSYNTGTWTPVTKTENMLQIVSKKPQKKCHTIIVAASTKEKEINNESLFIDFVKSL